MKKQIAMGIAGLVMLGAAGQASAYFEENHLTQVVYNKDASEVFVDLGEIGVDFNLTDKNVVLAGAGSIDWSMAGVASWSDLSMGVYADHTDLNVYGYSQYVATSSMVAPGVIPNGGLWDAFDSNTKLVNDYINTNYGGATSAVAVAEIATNPRSYWAKHNASGGQTGTYSSLLETGYGEGQLGALDTVGYVDMYLYHLGTDFDSYLATGDVSYLNTLLPNADGSSYAVLRLNADGSTILNPEVPLPGTVLLFGTSLLGLFGIRRREEA